MALTLSRQQHGDDQPITLAGELDSPSAPQLNDEVAEAAKTQPKRLVLIVHDLEYIASAGIRVLINAKQQMARAANPDVAIYVVAAHPQVVDTLQKTGIDRSVYMVDRYDPASVNG